MNIIIFISRFKSFTKVYLTQGSKHHESLTFPYL